MKSLIIDNYDSFTYNLYQFLAEINGELPIVITNDKISWTEIKKANFDNIIISPGPGNPTKREDFGVCEEIITQAEIPILGICLGHQGLGYYHGATVTYAPQLMHGRISEILHNNDSLFQNIPSQFKAVRYHSLILSQSLPSILKKIAWTKNDDLIMAIRHQYKPFWGVQFHPESICSEHGKQLLLNFRNSTQKFWQEKEKKEEDNLSLINKNNNNKINNQLKKQSKYQVYSHKLDFFLDSEIVFTNLYQPSNYSFWLDSSMVAEGLSQFSFMGDTEGEHSFIIKYQIKNQQIELIKQNKITLIKSNIFGFLEDYLTQNYEQSDELPFKFNGGFIGYFGYELKSLCEAIKNNHESNLPDAEFIFADRFIVFDHQNKHIYLIYLDQKNYQQNALYWFSETETKLRKILTQKIEPKNAQEIHKINLDITSNLTKNKEAYFKDIKTCLQKIKEGESYEICLTNQLHFPPIKNTFAYYCLVRKKNPVPYGAYLKLGENIIICSSPERFLSLDKNGWLESKPIKGTAKRGKTPEEDILLKENLKYSEKERAENLMIVDLLRNDLGKVCEIGTIYVPKLMAIESYNTVHQMVSTIRGKIKKNITAIDCIKASFPGGSMTGAPKKRTMEIIDQLETEARGIYSGSIGFLALNGTLDLNIVIRTAIITPKETSIGIGGAITALSSADKEFAEIILKAQGLIRIS